MLVYKVFVKFGDPVEEKIPPWEFHDHFGFFAGI
jgi:hypothetical protein